MAVLVTGAGGFIGGHLVRHLIDQDIEVVAVDIKHSKNWYQRFEVAENLELDLNDYSLCKNVFSRKIESVYNLAANMGGMGFIENNKALCMLSVEINTNLLKLCRDHDVNRYFFSSSACVYAAERQVSTEVIPLKESDAYPAMPEDGYGWEKLFSERMCRHFLEDFGLQTRVARYHNVYGPHGTFDGGREKAPAAICRKVAIAKLTGSKDIDIWGDGQQRRSFTWIDDCVRGTIDVHNGEFENPVNLGSSETVSINQLVDIAEKIAGVKLNRKYQLSAPQGVRGRTSDNTLFHSVYGWEPSTSLESGIEKTYKWIYDQLASKS